MRSFLEGLDAGTPDRALFLPALAEIGRRHGIDTRTLRLFSRGSNVVASSASRVIKLFLPPCLDQHANETRFLPRFSGRLPAPVPELIASGTLEGWPYLVMEELPGTPLEDVWPRLSPDARAALMSELGALMMAAHQIPVGELATDAAEWPAFLARQRAGAWDRHRARGLPRALLEDLEPFLDSTWPLISPPGPMALLTGEYTPPNILVEARKGRWTISGIIDFGDCRVGPADYDLIGPTTFSTAGDPRLLRALLEAYGLPASRIGDELRGRWMGLLLLHQFSDLGIQLRLEGWAYAPNLRVLATQVWP